MTASTDKLNKKFADKLARNQWKLDNAAGWNRLADEILVDEKTQRNGCFSAVVSVSVFLLAAAVIVKAVL